ncbi:uncharacterized protein LOC117105781 [Anneissia japonica]|uniref:uncharacterized protein LOC117105781 n=1 Tax=Anneissia japonica TaxID=1529436 RepID=UPI0014259EC8|nr:uncharacterized protein LOC117105781 [Anneissia japonica]
MASRLFATFIAIACLFGKFMFNEGAPTYIDESELYDVISDVDLEYDATSRERAKFPSIQLPKPFMNNDRPEPHPKPVESKPECEEKTKPSFFSNSGSSSPENMSFLARMIEHQRLAPATAPSFLPDANFRPFFPNPLVTFILSLYYNYLL